VEEGGGETWITDVSVGLHVDRQEDTGTIPACLLRTTCHREEPGLLGQIAGPETGAAKNEGDLGHLTLPGRA
jgi:hypothetical protein